MKTIFLFIACTLLSQLSWSTDSRNIKALFILLNMESQLIQVENLPANVKERISQIANDVIRSQEAGFHVSTETLTAIQTKIKTMLSTMDIGNGAVYMCAPFAVDAKGDRRYLNGNIGQNVRGYIPWSGSCTWYGGGDAGQVGWIDIDNIWNCGGRVYYNYGHNSFGPGEKSIKIRDSEYYSIYQHGSGYDIIAYGSGLLSSCTNCCP